ncbi:MAG: hypothetical protein GEU94_01800 [Micromonosporaceae bacterium]|nr:hypothetical protein [Micromonosporaceae bacterium]
MDMHDVVWGLELVWWLVIGIVLLALVLLALAVLPVAHRLSALQRANALMQRRVGGLEGLQARVESLQRRAAELEPPAAEAQARIARVKGDEPA